MNTFESVTLFAKANLYFDGNVVSHAFIAADGSRKSVGVIFAGSYNFSTEAAETMTIIDGSVRYRRAGENDWMPCACGESFDVAAHSSFDIAVDNGSAQYLCEYA